MSTSRKMARGALATAAVFVLLASAAWVQERPPAAREGAASARQTASSAPGKTLEEVLAGYHEAIGGLEGWRSLQSMRLAGRLVFPGLGMEAPFTVLAARPGRERVEFTVQGMTGIQATDGETAWQVMPFLGIDEPREMATAEARAFRRGADLDGPLVDPEASGIALELVEPSGGDGAEAYEVAVTYPDGATARYHLDAERFLPVRIEQVRTGPHGEEVAVEERLSDYRRVRGLAIAHRIEVAAPDLPGGAQVLVLEAVELDVPVEDSIFRMPGSAGSP